DRYNSRSAAWSCYGKWIYFISDRNLHSVVSSPWGSRAPDPYFDKMDKIYELSLKKGQRSPFEPPDELHPDTPEKKDEAEKKTEPAKPSADAKPAADAAKTDEKKDEKKDDKKDDKKVEIDLDGIAARIQEVPVSPGNYEDIEVAGKRICYQSFDR